MKTLAKTKLLGQHIEVRDYELFKQDLRLVHCKGVNWKTCSHIGEEYMRLPLSKQKEGKVINTQRSKFYPYNFYKIYTFLWKPEGKIGEL